jgi:hypothetical protein
MAIHNFDKQQKFTSIDELPDHRDEGERLFSPFAVYNHDSPDIAHAERTAEELINISGAWVTIFARSDNRGVQNETWDTDPDPVYKNGVQLKGFFAPEEVKMQLTKWGLDTENKTIIMFSRAVILKEFGKRMVRAGDVIDLPHNTLSPAQQADIGGLRNRIDKFRVLDSSDSGNFKYRWLYWVCQLEALTGGKTVQVEHK